MGAYERKCGINGFHALQQQYRSARTTFATRLRRQLHIVRWAAGRASSFIGATLANGNFANGGIAMGVYLISGAAAGILLSLRFNVIILIPGIFLALLIAAFCGVTQGQGIWLTLGTLVVVATAVQLGYLVGTIAPIGSGANRLSNRRRESIASGVSRLV